MIVIRRQIKVIVIYKYEKRITILLSQVVGCCGEIACNESVCADCKNLISKCSRLMARGQMPMSHYMELVRAAMSKK